jgi:periplasmic divalent cation tolerance protein
MTFTLLYVPIDSIANAKKVAKQLLEAKLIACANIFPIGTSIYPWKGKIEESAEIVMILKTSKSKLNKVKSAIRKTHPYDIPCILELPVKSVNKEYAGWLAEVLA